MWVTNGWRSGLVMLLAKTDPDAEPRAPGHDRRSSSRRSPRASSPASTIPMPGLQEARLQGRRVDGARVRRVPHARRRACSAARRASARGSSTSWAGSSSAASTSPRAASASRQRGARRRDRATRSEREAFGKPIAQHQAMQLKLAQMATQHRGRAAADDRRPPRRRTPASAPTSRPGWRSTSRPRRREDIALDGDAHPRRLRLLAGVRRRAALPRRAAAHPRRGLQRDPAARHRATAARAVRAADGLRPTRTSWTRSARPSASSARASRASTGASSTPDRVPGGVRRRADRGRLARRADPGGVRRRRASALTAASVILEEINRRGGNAGACHAQMYTMGTLLRHGSDAQKQRYLPKIATGELRLQAFGVTEPTRGSDTTAAADDGRCATATATSSTGRRSGSRARCTPT